MSGGHEGFVPGRYLIDAYGNGGFRFADMSHRGSILALPSGVKAWAVTSASEISEQSLVPVLDEAEAIDLLLLGTGTDVVALPERLRWRFRDSRIGLEIMQTGPAVRTYNTLVAENRRVAAALVAVG